MVVGSWKPMPGSAEPWPTVSSTRRRSGSGAISSPPRLRERLGWTVQRPQAPAAAGRATDEPLNTWARLPMAMLVGPPAGGPVLRETRPEVAGAGSGISAR